MKRFILVFAFSILLILNIQVLAAPKITLDVWDQFTESVPSQGFEKIVTAFEKVNPGVTIKRNPVSGDDLRKTLKTALASGTGPDIFYYEVGGRMMELTRAGLVYDLTADYKKYGWNKKIPAGVQDFVYSDGKMWGIPNELELDHIIFYRKSNFKKLGLKIPKTYPEFEKILETFKKQNVFPLAVGNNTGSVAFRFYNIFVDSIAGSKAVDDVLLGNGSWDQDSFIAAAKKVSELLDKGYMNPSPNAISTTDSRILFTSGQAGMLPSGSWDIRRFFSEASNPEDIDFFLIPPVAGKGSAKPSFGVGSAFYINSRLKESELAAAKRFMDFIVSDNATKLWIEAVQVVPGVRTKMKLNVEPLIQKTMNVIAASGDNTISCFAALLPKDVLSTARSASQGLWNKNINEKQFLMEIDKAWQIAKKEGRILNYK
jgi:raffinose/stachyose/melibiose transport system substrate-binding protein